MHIYIYIRLDPFMFHIDIHTYTPTYILLAHICVDMCTTVYIYIYIYVYMDIFV